MKKMKKHTLVAAALALIAAVAALAFAQSRTSLRIDFRQTSHSPEGSDVETAWHLAYDESHREAARRAR